MPKRKVSKSVDPKSCWDIFLGTSNFALLKFSLGKIYVGLLESTASALEKETTKIA